MDGINEINFSARSKNVSANVKNSSGRVRSVFNQNNSIIAETGEVNTRGLHEMFSQKLADIFTVKDALNKSGAKMLVPAADKMMQKGNAIVRNSTAAIYNLQDELSALSSNKNLSPEEIEAKQKLIVAKIDAIQKEGMAKLDIISTLAESLPRMIGLAKDMQDNGIPLSALTEIFDKLLENMSTDVSSFKDADSVEKVQEISKENLKNILGADTSDKTDKLFKEIESKIVDAKGIIKDPQSSKEEKSKAKLELKIYSMQKEIVNSLVEKIRSFEQ